MAMTVAQPASEAVVAGRLTDRVAVVTGAANGIGRAFAARLAADGADVAICDIADSTDIAAEVTRLGRRAYSVPCDITSGDAVADFARNVERQLGRCDILVHNAGIYPTAPFLEISYDQWRRVMGLNLDSVFHLGQAFLPGMIERGWGRIVVVASTTFHAGIGNHTHYVASKGGLIGFVRSLAAEVGAYGITANAIAPGPVWTQTAERSPQFALYESVVRGQAIKRIEEPRDLVGALSFLVSEDAEFMTGQTLVVDGGLIRA